MKMSLETQFYKIIWKKNHERWDVVTLKMMLAVMCPTATGGMKGNT